MSDEPFTKELRDVPEERLTWFHRQRPLERLAPAVRTKRHRVKAQLRTVARDAAGDPIVSGQPYWTPIGPSVNGHGQAGGFPAVSGRITAIAVAPGGQRAYVGAANGGTWLTEDHGRTWRPLDDAVTTPPALRVGLEEDSLAVGGLAVAFDATRADDVVFVGTGEHNHFVAPQFAGPLFNTGPAYFGVGVLRYTWSGNQAIPTLEASGAVGAPGSLTGRSIGRMIVNPDDPAVVWAVTGAGFFTRDGSGTWTRRALTPAPTYDIATDVVMAGSGTDRRLYVSYGGDGSQAVVGMFDPNQNPPAFVGVLTGIPRVAGTNFVWRVALAAVARAPGDHVVYALAESDRVYRATPATGSTFVQIASPPSPIGGNLAWYALALGVEPGTSDVLWLAGGASSTGAALWRGTVQSPGGAPTFAGSTFLGGNVHADLHAITFGDDGTVWVGSDGGVFTAQQPVAPGGFAPRNTGLAITQHTYIGQDPNTDAVVYAGTQDNGLLRFRGTPSWRHVGDGDGGGVAVDQLDPHRIFRQFFFDDFETTDGVSHQPVAVPFTRCAYSAPIATVTSPPTASIAAAHSMLAFAADKVWISDDWAQTWQPATGVIDPNHSATDDVAPTAVGAAVATVAGQQTVRVFAASPFEVVGVERQAGSDTWTTIPGVSSTGLPANRHIAALAIEDAALSRFYVTLAGAAAQRVWFFDGAQWHDAGLSVGGAALNVPAHAATCDGSSVYVGTDVGVFRGVRTGLTWQWTAMSPGLPECAVTDLAIHARTRLLRAATHGRGIWEYPLDPTVTGAQLDTELYFRATAADTGRVPNGARLPWIHGAPDPTRPAGSLTYYWQTPDVKVIEAGALPNPPGQPTFLEYDELVDHVDSGGTEQTTSDANHYFVQAHNRGWKTIASMRLALLVTNAGAGLPPLASPDYAAQLSTGGLGWVSAAWHTAALFSVPDPATVPVVDLNARNPLVFALPNVSFSSFGLPNTGEHHYCAAAFATTPDDQRAATSTSVDHLAMHDPHVALRNLHVIYGQGGGDTGDTFPYTFLVDFWNPLEREAPLAIDLVVENLSCSLSVAFSAPHERDWVKTVGFDKSSFDRFDESVGAHWERWTTARAVALEKRGARPVREGRLDGARLLRSRFEQLRSLDLEQVWEGRCRPGRRATFEGRTVPPHGRVSAAFTVGRSKLHREDAARLHVLHRRHGEVLGGNTYVVR